MAVCLVRKPEAYKSIMKQLDTLKRILLIVQPWTVDSLHFDIIGNKSLENIVSK